MTKHLFVNQLRQETTVPPVIIRKIYNDIIQHELTGDVYDNTTNYIGEITLAAPTYKEWADKVHEAFPSLEIHSQYYILFKDSVVESMMISHLLSKGIGDGIGITEANASNINVTDIPRFTDNTEIEYFDELVYFTRVTGFGDFKFSGCSNLKTINIQNITVFGNALFIQCVNLKSVVLNPLVKQLPSATFCGCESLESVNTEYIMKIGEMAFSGCKLLTSINSSNCTSIGFNAFNCCSSLETIDITNVTTFGSGCFDHCTSLQLGNNNHLICTTIPEYMFDDCPLISSLYIPNVTGIDRMAFCGCTSLTGVFQSSNVTYIKDSAFYGCKVLYYIDLSNCTSIGFNAFHNCETLTNIDLSAVVTIEHDAFRNCKGLTSINLSNCISIGDYAFDGCTSLTSIDLTNLTTMGRNCFSGCTNLNTVILGPNLKTIGIQVFSNCGYIQNIDFQYIENLSLYSVTVDFIRLSPNATEIAFGYLNVNEGIEVPASVTVIREIQFTNTPYIKFYGTTPPECYSFHNFNPDKIIVPRGYIDTYKNASTMWQRLADKTWEEFDP